MAALSLLLVLAITSTKLAILAPLIVLYLILLVVSLVDLARRDRVVGGNKWVWLIVILILGLPGQIGYLLFGRGAD